MNAQARIDKANAELAAAQAEQRRCPHTRWTTPKQEPRKRPVPVYSHLEGHGSDPCPVYNYHNETYYVWVRTCTCCGLTQETTHTEPVVSHYKPIFL